MRIARIALAVALVVAFVLLVRTLPVAEWLDAFKTWVRGAGPIGYVLYVLVYAVCCVLIIPALALTLGAGAIFGFAGGVYLLSAAQPRATRADNVMATVGLGSSVLTALVIVFAILAASAG